MDKAGGSRRSFLFSTGGALTGAWLSASWPAISSAAHHAMHAGAGRVPSAFEFLSSKEAADVEAIAAQIVPSDATPGAREAHVVYFIDRALVTFFSGQAHEFRSGLAEFQTHFRSAHPGATAFAAASPEDQVAFLKSVDQTPFFESIRTLTVLGMFSSPEYGGNYQGAGWKLLGFEDQHVFSPPFGYYDRDYPGFAPYPASERKS